MLRKNFYFKARGSRFPRNVGLCLLLYRASRLVIQYYIFSNVPQNRGCDIQGKCGSVNVIFVVGKTGSVSMIFTLAAAGLVNALRATITIFGEFVNNVGHSHSQEVWCSVIILVY
jgi:hypothetical protein